jgi:hypothetical protein
LQRLDLEALQTKWKSRKYQMDRLMVSHDSEDEEEQKDTKTKKPFIVWG